MADLFLVPLDFMKDQEHAGFEWNKPCNED
jgi:hypothetical protein